MSQQLISLLLELAEGKIKKVKCNSPQELEIFRQTLYKEKKDFDAGMYASMQDYEIQSLRFQVLPDNIVKLEFYTYKKKQLDFEILPDE